MRLLKSVRIAVALSALVFVAGCTVDDTPVVSNGLGLASSYGANCDFENPDTLPATTVLPKNAILVSVTRCVYENQTVSDVEWQVRLEQEATSGLDALADALRLPSERKPLNGACPAILYAPIILHVTDSAGTSLYPRIPLDACDGPLSQVTDAITALIWTTTGTTMVRQV